MEQILDAPVSTEKQFEYAGFWIRVGAYVIDAILLSFVQVIISYAIYGDYNMFTPRPALSLINLAVGLAYFCVMESSSRQGTFGKMAVGIKIGKSDGEPISFLNALGRYFAKLLSAVILGIGFMMVGWDPKKQGLHDKLANTIVFYSK